MIDILIQAGMVWSCTALMMVHSDAVHHQESIRFQGREWVANDAGFVVVEEHEGRQVLHVEGSDRTFVYLRDVEFRNGTIEVDFAYQARTTPGIGFHWRDAGSRRNRVVFNFRPKKDADGRTDVEQAIVTHGNGTTVVLNIRHPDEPGRQVHLPRDFSWIRVKIVFDSGQLRVFLNGTEQADFEVGAMFDGQAAGAVGVCGGGFYFTNFRYTSGS